MRHSIKVILVLAGLATLFAIVGMTASAQYMDFQDIEEPDWVYDSEEITVSYRLVSSHYSWDEIEATGLIWGTRDLGEFVNHTRFNYTEAEAIRKDMTYTVSFPAPVGPVNLPLHVWAKVKDVYGDYTLFADFVDVRVSPVVQFGGTIGWNMVGRDHEITAWVRNADAPEIEEVSVLWDTVSHAAGTVDKSLYPNRSAVVSNQLLAPYTFNITLPDKVSVVYIMVHGLINGRDFYDSAERGISVIDEPSFELTAPHAAFMGTNVVVNWSIPTVAGAYIVNTTVYWDSVSHAGAMDKANYAFHSDSLPGDDSRTYEVMLAMPDAPGTVYFVVNCIIKFYDEDFYTASEHMIALRAEPTVTITQYPDSTFAGADVMFVWTVSAEGEDVAETAIHWDTSSHAGALDISAYPHTSVWMVGEDDQTYEVTFEMPDDAGTVHFIAHALVLGEDFYVAAELSIEVRDLPTISITDHAEEGLAGERVTVTWEVTGALETDTFATFLHWNTTSHIDQPWPSYYAWHSPSIDWDASGEYSFELTLPEDADTVYVLVSTDIEDMTIVDPNEIAITVKALPGVVDVDGPDKVDGGEEATVTFTLEDVDGPEKVEVLWDTVSHDNASDYPNSVEATDEGNGTWSVTFKVPKRDGKVFYVVHVEEDGTDAYSAEGSFKTEKIGDDSPGYGFVMAVVALSLIAVRVASGRRN